MKPLLFAVWSAAAGALIPVMAVLNARLGRSLGAPTAAPLVLFAVALAAAMIVHFVASGRLPTGEDLQQLRLIDLAGGLIVAFYVVSVTLVAPRFGIGNTILFAMVAQIVTSAAIDHFGLFGVAVRTLSTGRMIGLSVLLIGLAMTQLFGEKPAS